MDLQSLKIDRQPKGGTSRRRRNPWPMRAALAICLGGAIWLFWTPVQSFLDRVNLPEVRTLLVTEASAASVAAVKGTAANGYVVAARRAALSSDVPGRIVELNVREGSVVKEGDIVARLFSDEFRAALERAAADHAVAVAAVERARALVAERQADVAQAKNVAKAAKTRADEALAGVTFAEREHERATELFAAELGSAREVERTRADLDGNKARHATALTDLATAELTTGTAERRLAVARTDVKVAEAQRDAADATRKQAQATLDKTDVRAPFDGVIVLKDAEVGEVVSPNSQGGSNARGAVCTMVDFASLEIQAEVPETSLSSVKLGAPADVFLDARPDEKLTGTVDRIWPTADRTKATVEVRIVVDEGQRERLRPEYGVRVVFRESGAPTPVEASASAEKRIVVPENALVEIEGTPTAFVIERDLVRAVTVTVGERKNGRATIESGLRAGQRIVAEPPPSLRDGDRVRFAQS
ncbi:MAG: efflux RND transporter periplasmic adaptor subunit [bacterium]|nr:efflux RND transporter periplasmic adaptor subunit [bacterium]